MNPPNGLSIVIPTEGRAYLTVRIIKRLHELRQCADFPSEVLVIDSSTDADYKAIAEACSNEDAVLIKGPASVRAKRNIGIQHANFSPILFLDSDCDPSVNLLKEHWKVYTSTDELNVGGVLGRLEFVGSETFAWKIVRHSSLVRHFYIAKESKYASWGATANLSILREAIDSIGLFDENFPFKLGGDDLDFTYRLTQAGWHLVCNPEALAYHDLQTWSSLGAVLKRALRWGRMEYYLFEKHKTLQIPHPPTLFGWFVFVLFISLVNAAVFQSLLFLAVPVGWLVLAILFFSFFAGMSCAGSNQSKWSEFKESLLSSIPELFYQLGSSLEFIRHADIRFFYSRPLLNSGGVKGIWLQEARNTWSNLLALLICYSIILLVMRF